MQSIVLFHYLLDTPTQDIGESGQVYGEVEPSPSGEEKGDAHPAPSKRSLKLSYEEYRHLGNVMILHMRKHEEEVGDGKHSSFFVPNLVL